jgi:hypothetical protein
MFSLCVCLDIQGNAARAVFQFILTGRHDTLEGTSSCNCASGQSSSTECHMPPSTDGGKTKKRFVSLFCVSWDKGTFLAHGTNDEARKGKDAYAYVPIISVLRQDALTY